ncbi:MAG: dTMP kinase [Melioribacteraceae bacterium]|nr:dTMP kinase [Melioribacteraceae bacterium]MCF8263803.1 dTMP kinase [Melioribacteraceae bacterium]MCF8412110.1 dTMP kinase [Melioribacteraceae bacterium]MCF8432360.1 dTMP kinase [Melioribacteraceae bacterium]
MFITFEGLDFCGKSTQVDLLIEYFESRGDKITLLREPGGTEISEKIRSILLDKKNNLMNMETELLLFCSSRAQLVREKIIPLLEKGNIVISDRFYDSSTAYQGFGRGLDIDFVINLHKFVAGKAIPDITFFIDLPLAEIEKRKKGKEKSLDRIESSKNGFYEKVRNGYHFLVKKEQRFRLIDGTKSIEEVHDNILEEIRNFERRN